MHSVFVCKSLVLGGFVGDTKLEISIKHVRWPVAAEGRGRLAEGGRESLPRVKDALRFAEGSREHKLQDAI